MKAAVLRSPGSVPEYADFGEPPVPFSLDSREAG